MAYIIFFECHSTQKGRKSLMTFFILYITLVLMPSLSFGSSLACQQKCCRVTWDCSKSAFSHQPVIVHHVLKQIVLFLLEEICGHLD